MNGTNIERLLFKIKELLAIAVKNNSFGGGGNQFALRDIILETESFEIDALSQRIVKEELVINGELIINGRLYIEP